MADEVEKVLLYYARKYLWVDVPLYLSRRSLPFLIQKLLISHPKIVYHEYGSQELRIIGLNTEPL